MAFISSTISTSLTASVDSKLAQPSVTSVSEVIPNSSIKALTLALNGWSLQVHTLISMSS